MTVSSQALNFDPNAGDAQPMAGQGGLKGWHQLAQFGGGSGAAHQQAPLMFFNWARFDVGAQGGWNDGQHEVQAALRQFHAIPQLLEHRGSTNGFFHAVHAG